MARTALNRSFTVAQVIVDAVRDDFGVGLGDELVAELRQVGAQLLVVLDDAVVDDRESVVGDVGMRVALARHAVGGPARVRDADLAAGGLVLDRLLQGADLAHRAQAHQVLGAVQHGEAGRVVAAVLQPPQALHQDGTMLRSATAPTIPHMIIDPPTLCSWGPRLVVSL